jgi:hypothetical protein
MPLRYVVVSVLLLSGCGQGELSNTPSALTAPSGVVPTSAAADATAASHAAKASGEVIVNMQDACDPDTFNAAIAPGTCVRNGGITFANFIEQLTHFGSIGAWHFAPPNSNLLVGQSFLAVNHGGEVHTFTEVEEFGGGIVPTLNNLAHTPNVAPECLALDPDDFVAPGASYHSDVEEEGGDEKYQCCIHPWMRLEAHVREK